MLRGRVILGSPEEVAAELRRYDERFGINHFLCRVGWPGMDPQQVHRAVHLLGTEVLPRLNG
jgi:alkanesulfonate monooxygenase SsuD/methylene tetrahydromethanopterin reductase-like flavin-dependent oxidoreductase (luciferase family)